jgi:uncharacterized protein YraI
MRLLFVALSFIVVSSGANAGLRCSTDYFGNQTCYGTGQDSGYTQRRSTDYFGNDTYRDNRGNTTRCSTDYFGNYNCR